jgi:hypothetical protein
MGERACSCRIRREDGEAERERCERIVWARESAEGGMEGG